MIRLKELLESGEYSSGKYSVNTKDPNNVQYWMIKHAPSIAQQLGETTSRLLGGGLNGLAWLLQSGRVIPSGEGFIIFDNFIARALFKSLDDNEKLITNKQKNDFFEYIRRVDPQRFKSRNKL